MTDDASAPRRIEVDDDTVRALLRAQAPTLASSPITRLATSGTVNALFRVDDAVVRLPILVSDWSDPRQEARTLERVAPALSVGVPPVRLLGEPGEGYPSHWLILGWLTGLTPQHADGGIDLADDLTRFLRELREVDTTHAPASARPGFPSHDSAVRESLTACADLVDAPALEELWTVCLSAPRWQGTPQWVHGDLLWGNLLLDERARLEAVLDWESAGIGDPAVDLMVAWSVLDRTARAHLRDGLGLDDATWVRGQAWALAQAAVALAYYRGRNAAVAHHSREVLRELARTSGS